MADMTITGDARFGSVISEMKRVEKASDSLKRKVGGGSQGRGGYQRGGMGVLEISRGVEDFAVAGMRGLLNNIPGIIMSLGGGMGLAGVVSLAAVAVTVLGKGLVNMVNNSEDAEAITKANKEATDKYVASLNAAKTKLSEYRIEQKKAAEQDKQAASIKEMMRRFGDPESSFEQASAMTKANRGGRDSVNALKNELAALSGQGGITLPTPVADLEEDAASVSKLIDDLLKQRSNVERELSKNIIEKAPNVGEKISDIEVSIAAAERSSARHKANMEIAAKNSDTMYEKAAKTLMEMENRKIAEGKAALAALMMGEEFNDKEISTLREKLDAIDAQVAAANSAAESAALQLQYAKEEEALRRKIAQYGEMNDQPSVRDFMLFQAQEAKRIEAAFKDIDSVLSRMGLAGGDMLSSSGKIGGSVTEYNSAIATINYQRDTLKELRTIARNTAKKLPATYN